MRERIALREFQYRCGVAEAMRRLAWKCLRIADKVDGLSRRERRMMRAAYARYLARQASNA